MGTEVATYTNGFYVNQGSAVLVSLTPNSAAQGTQASIAVSGTNTNFQQGATTAYFRQNIGVNSVTVTDLTHATVNITFNKAVNRSSLSSVNALTLFAGDANVNNYNFTYSADGRTISFTPTMPPNSTINIDATPLITDLSGNPLVNFTSSYSTIADIPGTSPAEVGMLPGNGKSDVLTTTPISILTNGAALDPSTVTSDSFHV